MPDDKKIAVKIENLLGKKEALSKKISDKTESKEIKKEKAVETNGEKTSVEIAPIRTVKSDSFVLPASSLSVAGVQLKQRQKQVEKVLEKNLEKIYSELPYDKKKEFKIIGKQTAVKINLLLNKTKIKIKNIINLIKKWLMIIPGISKYFIEQEAKIKADEIVKMKNK